MVLAYNKSLTYIACVSHPHLPLNMTKRKLPHTFAKGPVLIKQACQSLEVISVENKKMLKKSMYSPLYDGNDVITC